MLTLCPTLSARNQFHKAQLSAQRSARRRVEAGRAKQEREQLLGDAPDTAGAHRARRREKLSTSELAVSASGDVTAALRRTHQLMQSELQRSRFAHETLQRSTAALTQLNESYSTLDSLLVSSKSLVSTLVSSQKSDSWYLETTAKILLGTLVWIIFRRIAYGPIWWFLYLPLKWAFRILLALSQSVLSYVGVSAGAKQTPLRSLKVQPSATGRGYTRNPGMPAASVRVGSGGEGARRAQGDPVEEVGRMAEQARRRERGQEPQERSKTQQKDQGMEEAEPPEAQEGETELREREDDEPPNPKKRMWEEPLPEHSEMAKDEL